MEYKVNVMISNRHVHLTEDDYNKLFDKPITIKKELNQVGGFAANEVVNIKNGDKVIENVRIVGPFRSYNQVEISKSDARKLGLNPPVRRSGDLIGAENIEIFTEKGSILVSGAIIANRHVHMNPSDALKYGVVDKQKVVLKIDGDKSGTMDAEVKVSEDGYYEVHIDTDDANAFLLNNNDEVTLIV